MSTGLLRPFRRDGRSGFQKGTGNDVVEGRLEAIVASDGVLPWKPELNSNIDRIRNRSNGPMLQQFAQVYVQDAVKAFEPGLTSVDVDAERDGDTLTITLNAQLSGSALEATAKL